MRFLLFIVILSGLAASSCIKSMTNRSKRDKDSVYVPIPEAQYANDSFASGLYYLPHIRKLFNNQLSPDSISKRLGHSGDCEYDTFRYGEPPCSISNWENYVDDLNIDKEFCVLAYYSWYVGDGYVLDILYDATVSPMSVIDGFLTDTSRYPTE